MKGASLILLLAGISLVISQRPGAFAEISLDLNETGVNATKDLAKRDIISQKGYSESSYNLIPLALFSQIVNGINYKIFYGAQEKGSDSVDLFEYDIYSGPFSAGADDYTITKSSELEEADTQKLTSDLIRMARLKNAIGRHFFPERKGTKQEEIKKSYKKVLFNTVFHIVNAVVGDQNEKVNLLVIEREDKTFEVISELI